MPALHRRVAAALSAALVLVGGVAATAVATAPVDAPLLTEPSEGEDVHENRVLKWEAVPGAVRYRVELSTSPAFTPLNYSATTYARRATPPVDLPLGTLYWRVRGLDAGGAGGPFATGTFDKLEAAAPTLVGPPEGSIKRFPTHPVVLSWNPRLGARQYRVEIDDASDFIGAQNFVTSNTTFTLTDLQPINQWFYWHIQAISPAGINSAFSATRWYQVSWPDAPTLLKPDPDATVTDVVFSWQAIAGAASYDLEVSPNGDWANNVTLRKVVKGTRYAPPETLDNGSYFWRVRGRDARTSGANVGPWSAERQFDRAWESALDRVNALPMTQDPSGQVSTPTFQWTAARHASHYELQVSTDVNFSPSGTNPMQCFTNRTTFTPYIRNTAVGPSAPAPAASKCDIELSDGQPYWWRVRPLDGPTITSSTDAVNGAWSNTISFTFQRSTPVLTSPAAGDPLVLRWTAVPDMDAYDVTIVKHGIVEVTERTHALSFSPIVELKAHDGPFTWYVEAVDHDGVKGLATATSPSFTLPTIGVAGPTPEPVGPQALSSHRAPSLRWTPVTGADFYKVYSFAGGILTPFDNADKVPFPSFTPTEMLAPGPHSWKVEAWSKTTGKLSTTSAAGSFVIAEPDLGAPFSPCSAGVACLLQDTPMLRWNSAFNDSERVGYYIVYVALDPLFTNIFREYRTVFTSLTPRESYLDSQAGQSYYWFVRPCTASTCGPFNESVYGNAFRFRKKSPPVVARLPAHDATQADLVRFTWDDFLRTDPGAVPQEARQYRIQVSTAADFSTVLDEQDVDQIEYTPFDLTYPEGPLYWRVQAIDGSRNPLTWNELVDGSQRRVIKQSAPTQLPQPIPPTETLPAPPSLEWETQLFAAGYEVEVYKDGDTNYSPVNRVLTQTTKLTAWTPSTALPSGTYAWRVRRLDADARPGTWSSDAGPAQRVLFRIAADPAELTAPEEGEDVTTDDFAFEWDPDESVAGAVQYRIDVSASPGFSPMTESVTTVMNTWAPVKKYADGTYSWRVSVIGGAGTVLSTSPVGTFDKDSSPPTVVSVTPVTGVPLEGPLTVTFSEPVTGVTGGALVVRVASTATVVPGAVSQPTATTAQFVPTAPLVPGQSYTVSLTAAVHDLHDNPLIPDTRTVRAATVVESGSPVIKERWDGESSSRASAGHYEGTATRGAASTFTFSGTSVAIYGMRSSSGGYADVYVDGVKQSRVLTCYRARTTTPLPALLWSRAGLSATAHTVVVRARGTRPSASKGNWVWIDKYRVGATVYEESSSAVVESFGRVTSASAYAGSYALESGRNSSRRASYTMAFKGTRVTWYSTRSPGSGMARVYVDGLLLKTVNLYSSSTAYKAAVFGSAALSDQTHTLKIVLMETKDARSTGRRVALDRLRVT